MSVKLTDKEVFHILNSMEDRFGYTEEVDGKIKVFNSVMDGFDWSDELLAFANSLQEALLKKQQEDITSRCFWSTDGDSERGFDCISELLEELDYDGLLSVGDIISISSALPMKKFDIRVTKCDPFDCYDWELVK